MAEDRSDQEANGSSNAHTAAVKCLHQKILEGTLGFVRPFILMKKANAVVFKPLRQRTAQHVAIALGFAAAQQVHSLRCLVVDVHVRRRSCEL